MKVPKQAGNVGPDMDAKSLCWSDDVATSDAIAKICGVMLSWLGFEFDGL
jgi:hypothetical protein